ncbi:MAG: hypothetical protein RIR95_399 [Pseudomonadota bacterium]
MPELIAKRALPGKEPFVRLGTTLAEAPLVQMTSLALFPGQEKVVNKALKPLGLQFPAPGEAVVKDDIVLLWTGREQAFLIGVAAPAMGGSAAATDQSDAWVHLTLSGPQAVEVLARYVPMDLRLTAFAVNRVARTPLYHMSAVIHRTGDDSFRVMVFRSMAQTAWHDLSTALDTLAARAPRA